MKRLLARALTAAVTALAVLAGTPATMSVAGAAEAATTASVSVTYECGDPITARVVVDRVAESDPPGDVAIMVNSTAVFSRWGPDALSGDQDILVPGPGVQLGSALTEGDRVLATLRVNGQLLAEDWDFVDCTPTPPGATLSTDVRCVEWEDRSTHPGADLTLSVGLDSVTTEFLVRTDGAVTLRHPIPARSGATGLAGPVLLPIGRSTVSITANGQELVTRTYDVPLDRCAGFHDVAASSTFRADITWLVSRSVTSGYPDGTFRPGDAVSRAAMAAFLYRLAGRPAYTAPTTPTFADVPTSSPFHREVQWLAEQRVTTGTTHPDGTRTFSPGASVSREAMAAFLYRSAGSPAFSPPARPTFTDVTAGSTFHREIEWLAATGISTGSTHADGTRTYNPGTRVSREAMAAFLHRLDRYVAAG